MVGFVITLEAAEEGGFGKVMLYDKGAYDEMDVCLMSVPLPVVQIR
jgi:hypothetical protein